MTPVASASLAVGLSASFVNSSVSSGSTSFRRKSLPVVIRNGFANSRALLMTSFVFIRFSFVRIEHRQLAHDVFSFGELNGTKVQWLRAVRWLHSKLVSEIASFFPIQRP